VLAIGATGSTTGQLGPLSQVVVLTIRRPGPIDPGSASGVWTLRDKLIGTLLVPGGLLPLIAMLTLSAGECADSANRGCRWPISTANPPVPPAPTAVRVA
jgi:hypothetical protein